VNWVMLRYRKLGWYLGLKHSGCGGITYQLSTPSAEQSGLKLQVNQICRYSKWNPTDFDANASIVETGSNLQPKTSG
jgi:hypothetical protein